ncbi:MAG: 16S rRNA (cytidine(1402)-2'-O)-methyltransferase [Opitutia bacterium]
MPAPGPKPGGMLLLVATPLGNLGDLSPRAREALSTADVVACEDTRTTANLLRLAGIGARSLSAYHDHNESEAAEALADRVAAGQVVAVVTDAGTPGLSDPGFRAARACARRGLRVSPIPGPNAAIALLSASGLPTNAFRFVGFLPPKSAARRRFLAEEVLAAAETVVLHESCHRVDALLGEMLEILGPDRAAGVGRELTKLHESVRTGRLGELVPAVRAGSLKGEFTLAIGPAGYALVPALGR